MQSFHIPCTVVRGNPYDVPVMPVSASDMVRIMVRYCAYQALKQAISRTMKKSLSDVSCWHTDVCTRLLFFVNLRPKESQRANSRKINGVEQKTQTEKPQHAYNLKERLQGSSGLRRTILIRD